MERKATWPPGALYTLVTVCLDPEALRYIGETVRVFLVPELFGGIAVVVGLLREGGAPRTGSRTATGGLSVGNPGL